MTFVFRQDLVRETISPLHGSGDRINSGQSRSASLNSPTHPALKFYSYSLMPQPAKFSGV
jgi:hypothetical protein